MGRKLRLGSAGRVAKPSRAERIAILGMGKSLGSWIADRYSSAWEGEIWTINYASFVFQHTLAFNMHDMETDAEQKRWAGWDRPVLTIKSHPDHPNWLEYPLEDVMTEFRSSWFRNSVAYAIAFACLSKVRYDNLKMIYVVGCDFDYVDENGKYLGPIERGKDNVSFWLGIALQLGIEVVVAPGSTLTDMSSRIKSPNLYGYEGNMPEIGDAGQILSWESHGKSFEEIEAEVESSNGNAGNTSQ